jgi:uncharacterized protein YndB with AHSA1/START domain
MPGGNASIHVDATPEAVYDLITDVTRMSEWSPETYKAEWRNGATEAMTGARFRGWNKMGPVRWFTDPIVERAERGKEFAFTTTFFGRGRFTTWSYRMHPSPGGGTELEESWEECNPTSILTRVFANDRRAKQLQQGMEQTLQRLKASAERR